MVRQAGVADLNTYRNTYETTGSDLALLGKRFVVGPVHDAGGQRIARDILDLSTNSKGASRGREEGMDRF